MSDFIQFQLGFKIIISINPRRHSWAIGLIYNSWIFFLFWEYSSYNLLLICNGILMNLYSQGGYT